MKKIVLISLLFGVFQFANAQKKTTIFNKKDLAGWTIYGTEKWFVENGELVCESGPDKGYGYLGTEKSYKDFELTLMFKQEANGNSGVFFHSTITGTRVAGWQVEVAPKGHDTGGIYESYKRGWIVKPDKSKDDVLKVGGWNKMKIRVQGNHVITWLNGTEMVNHTDDAYGSIAGSIALQIHDGGGIKVRWKKLIIKEL
jgi:Domain of Unknown Function (DUF1080)